MTDTVMVPIPLSREAAEVLADPERLRSVGRMVSDLLRSRANGIDPLRRLLDELHEEVRAAGLTEEEVDAELAAYNAERRS